MAKNYKNYSSLLFYLRIYRKNKIAYCTYNTFSMKFYTVKTIIIVKNL